jgi:HAD superfamily hydrolase (TIGR01509 family)
LRLLQQLGLQTYYRGFFRVWDRDFLDAVHRGERPFRDALEAFLFSAGLSRGQIEEVWAACQARRRELNDSARPLPGVRTTLAQLVENGWTLGILCNSECSSTQLRTQLTRLGMDGWFRAVVSSLDLQHAMPDSECYQAALAEMRMTASDVVFVGHDAVELQGAAAAGMATLAFNFEPDAEADGYLSRFEDLLNMVKLPSLPLAAAG